MSKNKGLAAFLAAAGVSLAVSAAYITPWYVNPAL